MKPSVKSLTLVAVLAGVAAPAWAQTTTSTTEPTTTTTTNPTTTRPTTTTTTPTTNPTTTPTTTVNTNPAPSTPGAFDQLSPGNQSIARALFEAQTPAATSTPPTSTSTTGTSTTTSTTGTSGPVSSSHAPMTLDQIATAKGSTAGGQVFKQMKTEG